MGSTSSTLEARMPHPGNSYVIDTDPGLFPARAIPRLGSTARIEGALECQWPGPQIGGAEKHTTSPVTRCVWKQNEQINIGVFFCAFMSEFLPSVRNS